MDTIERLAGRLLELAGDPAHCTQPVALTAIDATRPFLPPAHTQLFHTPLWADLDPRHQLRYTQLYGLRSTEMVRLFERFLAQRLAHRVDGALADRPLLRRLLATMAAEELRHEAGFAALNRASRPDLYAHRDFVFFPPGAEVRAAVAIMGLCVRYLAYPLWLLFYIEEASLAVARDMVAMDGEIEPNWLAVYREHATDEARHTVMDRMLLDAVYGGRSEGTRRLDGWMFERILRALMLPRATGAGMRVADQLIRDCPELAPLRPVMRREIVALGDNPAFLASLMSERTTPQSWRLFRRRPELGRLGRWVPGYA